jgi:hypothetical protein
MIGEQPLDDTTGNLGTLARQAIQSATYTVVSQTRHSSFLTSLAFNVVEGDYLLSSFSLPERCMQISNLFYRNSTTDPVSLVKLQPRRRDELAYRIGYCIIGTDVFMGHELERPFDVILEYYAAPNLEDLTDAATIPIVQEVTKAIEITAAAWLSLAYLDDLAQQNSFEKLSQFEIDQLRKRSGVLRAPTAWR